MRHPRAESSYEHETRSDLFTPERPPRDPPSPGRPKWRCRHSGSSSSINTGFADRRRPHRGGHPTRILESWRRPRLHARRRPLFRPGRHPRGVGGDSSACRRLAFARSPRRSRVRQHPPSRRVGASEDREGVLSRHQRVPTCTASRTRHAARAAPWPELQPLCTDLAQQQPRPGAVAGRCSTELARLAPEGVLEIVRTAGLYPRAPEGAALALAPAASRARSRHSSRHWPKRLASTPISDPCGLVAQRLPWMKLRRLEPAARLAHLFGLAGFLPGESAARLRTEPRAWLRELWEFWWKARVCARLRTARA